jgi:hypothetical protein
MSWQDELEEYISRINEKAYDRLMEEWPPERTYGGGADALQAEREIRSLADIHPNLIRFADGHPASCEHMEEKFDNVRDALRAHIHDDIGDVRDAIVGWYDPVANAFRDYLGESETAVVWRLDYVEALSGIAELQKEILVRKRQDIRKIGDKVLEALDQPVDAGFDFSLGDAFKLAAAVAAVGLTLSTPLPGDEAAAIVVAFELVRRVKTVFDSGVAAADALSPPAFEGRRTVEILESAYGALDKVVDAVEQQEGVVARALTALYQGLDDNEDKFNPRLRPVDVNSVEQDELRSVDPEGLRIAARDNLPTMASDNRAAALHVASIEENEPHAFEGEMHDGPLNAWRARREVLQFALGDTATAIDDIAAKLDAIAATYADNEETQAQGFTGISAGLEGA